MDGNKKGPLSGAFHHIPDYYFAADRAFFLLIK